jgi:TPR repeat protein
MVPKQAGTNAQASRAFANAMFARGRAAEEQGDISGARRFYTAAAQNGLADAARAVSRLYDPIYLRQKTIGGIAPDPQLSRQWHDRAVEMDAQSSPANPSSSHPQALTAR